MARISRDKAVLHSGLARRLQLSQKCDGKVVLKVMLGVFEYDKTCTIARASGEIASSSFFLAASSSAFFLAASSAFFLAAAVSSSAFLLAASSAFFLSAASFSFNVRVFDGRRQHARYTERADTRNVRGVADSTH